MKQKDNKNIFDIYKMYVETTQHISNCRQQSNNFYILLNSGIVAYNAHFASFFISMFGILINIVWILKIKSYKNLNSAKFKVINKLEKFFPVEVFNDEYKILKNTKYKSLSDYEIYVPWIFILLFLLVSIYKYWNIIYKILNCCISH